MKGPAARQGCASLVVHDPLLSYAALEQECFRSDQRTPRQVRRRQRSCRRSAVECCPQQRRWDAAWRRLGAPQLRHRTRSLTGLNAATPDTGRRSGRANRRNTAAIDQLSRGKCRAPRPQSSTTTQPERSVMSVLTTVLAWGVRRQRGPTGASRLPCAPSTRSLPNWPRSHQEHDPSQLPEP